ncbi:alpha/beta fold hydrolase [Nocardia higoensis]|uniref:alpha/beta fold hydrolase n=1 Tax=Nocardia higoensis TaxID=228599 RepID=UPI0003161AE3|nr:alpha/beta hydrolase [Nocardia higoensis]
MQNYRSVWTYLDTVPHTLDWIDAGGVRTRYLTAGDPDGPVVLLLHGTAGSLENFCANYGALARTHRVIGIDMLGCGYTDKPDHPYLIPDYAEHALAVLDALGVAEAAVIGVSLGSWVGARMALDHPNRVNRLVMIAPAGIIVDPEEEKKFGADVRRRRSNAAEAPSWESVTAAMGRLMLNQEDLLDDLVAVRLRIYQQPEMAEAMKHLLAFTTGGQDLSREDWARLRQPVLVIAAVDAPNMFLDNARLLAQLVPNVEVVDMTGCDHWAQFERAEEFNELAQRFLTADERVSVA